MEKYHYGYDEAQKLAKMTLPTEDEVLQVLEMAAQGFHYRDLPFDPIVTLNNLIKQKEAKQLLEMPVEKFHNSALQNYAERKINEDQLWTIIEKVVKILP